MNERLTILEVTQREDVLQGAWHDFRLTGNDEWSLTLPLIRSTKAFQQRFVHHREQVYHLHVDGKEHFIAIHPELKFLMLFALQEEARQTVYKKLSEEIDTLKQELSNKHWKLVGVQACLDEFKKLPWWKRMWLALQKDSGYFQTTLTQALAHKDGQIRGLQKELLAAQAEADDGMC